MFVLFFLYGYADHRDLHLLTHFFPTRRSADLDPWPAVQYQAMVKSAAAICRYYGWSEKSTIGHLEWSDWKIDPRGFTMAKFRADVKAALALPAGKGGSDLADTGELGRESGRERGWQYV